MEFESNIGNLRFSKETVYLDTVFTNIGLKIVLLFNAY
jgi:hypothetical protein